MRTDQQITEELNAIGESLQESQERMGRSNIKLLVHNPLKNIDQEKRRDSLIEGNKNLRILLGKNPLHYDGLSNDEIMKDSLYLSFDIPDDDEQDEDI